MLPALAAGVKLNADGWVCLWAFAWILAFGAIYPLYGNRGAYISPRCVCSIGCRVWEQGGGGKSYCPWQQKKPLSNCKPTPGPSESAGEMAARAADVSIIFNNRNASRARQPRGASAFMQVDEHEAGSGRTRSSTVLRRLFALFVPLLQFLSYCKKHLPPLYIPIELVAINYSLVQYILLYNCLHYRERNAGRADAGIIARGRGRCLHDGRGGGGSIYARALYIIYINGRRLQYTRAHARDGERRNPDRLGGFLPSSRGAGAFFAVRIAGGPAPSPRPGPCTVAALALLHRRNKKGRGKSPRLALLRCISAAAKIIEKI